MHGAGWQELLEATLAVVFIVLGGLGMGWFKILKETNALLKTQNEELKTDNKEWQKKHAENEKAIAKLQGQIDTIKNIPLQEISEHMRKQTEVNQAILGFIQTIPQVAVQTNVGKS